MDKGKIIIISIALLGCVLNGCGKNGKSEKEQERPLYPVKVENVTRKTLYQTVEAYGDVRGQKESKIYSKVAGKLLKKIKSEGETVKEDEVIALVDRDEVAVKYAEAEILSPIDGTVTKYYVTEGASVFPNQEPIAMVSDTANVLVDVYANLEDLAKINVGQLAKCSSDSLPGTMFWGKVTDVDTSIDPMTRKSKVCIEIRNQSGVLKSGMFLKTEIITQVKNHVIAVNEKAIIDKDEGKFVALVAGDAVKLVAVDLGVHYENFYEIIGALEEGNKVIVEGNYGINEGAKVKIVE